MKEKIHFPEKAIYRRNKNRLYFSNDFSDGTVVTFYCFSDKPSSSANGYAWYLGQTKDGFGESRLVHISELETSLT